MILKQKDFSYKTISNKYLDIIDDFITDNNLKGCFYNNFREQNTDKQIHNLIDTIRSNNLDFQVFFQDYKNQILDDTRFTSDGYFMDFFLYYFDSKYTLGGQSLEDGEIDEHVVKYKYGWFKYNLGKEYILQSYKSLEEFFYETAKCFIFSMLVGNEIRNEFQLGLTGLGNSDVLHIPDTCSIVKKEQGYTALIIHLKLFFSLLDKFKEDMDLLKLLEEDLKKMQIYHYFDGDYLILFFGKNEGKIKLPKEAGELDMKYHANKYNL